MLKIKRVIFASFLLLTGCFSVQLAPDFDASLFKQITATNVEVMQLFATVSSGTDKSSFPSRQANYNAIIGKLDAMALQSRSRPIPDAKVLEKINKRLGDKALSSDPDEIPSATALTTISDQISKMRDVDKTEGLNKSVVAVFSNGVQLSMQQVITYESFLKR